MKKLPKDLLYGLVITQETTLHTMLAIVDELRPEPIQPGTYIIRISVRQHISRRKRAARKEAERG